MSITDAARDAVSGPRNADYGPPHENMARTAALWSPILGIEVTPSQVVLCMLQVKIAREVHRPKRDNRVDIAGWAEALDEVEAWHG